MRFTQAQILRYSLDMGGNHPVQKMGKVNKMTHYKAIFSDGHIAEIKNSKKEYGAAYRIAVKWKPLRTSHTKDADGYVTTYYTGFSRDVGLAQKSAMSESAVARRGTLYANKFHGEHNRVADGAGEIVFREVVAVQKVGA